MGISTVSTVNGSRLVTNRELLGHGGTMTEQDILEGRMIIEIGIAAVRPAEFILLKFSHKLQQA